MQLIRCTAKLLKELKQDPVANVKPIRDVMGGWHANLLRIERRKCVLVTNDKTLYTIFIPGLKKQEFIDFDEVFRQHLFKNLLHEELSQNRIEAVLDELGTIRFARTDNRSVLGSMNDLKFQLEFHIASRGGLACTPLYELNARLNRTPFSAIDNRRPIDRLSELLDTQCRETDA